MLSNLRRIVEPQEVKNGDAQRIGLAAVLEFYNVQPGTGAQ
jgi:hypothetical protein